MANMFSEQMNKFGDWLGQKIAPYINDALGVRGHILSNYYTGDHRPQLKKREGQPDDNIIQNFVGLAVDRSVSRLLRGGVKFVLPKAATGQKDDTGKAIEKDTEQQMYIDKIWDLNKKEIILFQFGLHGAYFGTTYFKISPEGIEDPYTKELYPRLIAVDPETVRIKTAPQDMNDVEEYIIEYKFMEHRNGRDVEVEHREITKHPSSESVDEAGVISIKKAETWVVEEWERAGSAAWEMVSSVKWDYDFPPIIHCKNLPSLKSCYGDSEIDDAINIQDKSNFVVSNTGKIIKNFAHPETFVFGIDVKQLAAGKLDSSVGNLYSISNENARVENLELQSDLGSSVVFGQNLRQSIFDIAREVDISSMADKLGQLTNFGLQVLWSDAIDKNNTKRQLYGDCLLELNRRLLVLAGYEAEASQPGTIQWGSPVPVNVMEEMTADEKALSMGVIDKETVANRYFDRYGKKWEDIQKIVEEEKKKAQEENANIGAMVLKNFKNGKGVNVGNNNARNAPE